MSLFFSLKFGGMTSLLLDGFINPGSPMGPFLSKNSAQRTALQQRVTSGPAQIPNDRPKE